jgi:phosphopantetheinyl transferase
LGCKSNEKSNIRTGYCCIFVGRKSIQNYFSGMPLSREFSLGEGIQVGIWHITENASELLESIILTEPELELYHTYSHEGRKRQWLASRAALRLILPPAIPASFIYDEHGKPTLAGNARFVSVSHSGDYAAVVCSKKSPVGIDIEELRDRIERVKERFLCTEELAGLETVSRLEKLYVLWGAKEALYKLYGTPEVDFKRDIYIHPFDYLCNMHGMCRATLTTPEYTKEFDLYYEKMGGYMLTIAF